MRVLGQSKTPSARLVLDAKSHSQSSFVDVETWLRSIGPRGSLQCSLGLRHAFDKYEGRSLHV